MLQDFLKRAEGLSVSWDKGRSRTYTDLREALSDLKDKGVDFLPVVAGSLYLISDFYRYCTSA
jgi:hypothetical protein